VSALACKRRCEGNSAGKIRRLPERVGAVMCHREANHEEKESEKRMKTNGHRPDGSRLQKRQKQGGEQQQIILTMNEKVNLHRQILVGEEAVADDEEMRGRMTAAADGAESSPAGAPLLPLHRAHQSGTEIEGWEDSRHVRCQAGERMPER
jgi:hypothetical protein